MNSSRDDDDGQTYRRFTYKRQATVSSDRQTDRRTDRQQSADKQSTAACGHATKAIICVCLFVCPQHNSKKSDPKIFKLGLGNGLGISYKWYSFGVKRSRSQDHKVQKHILGDRVGDMTAVVIITYILGVYMH